jgi:hypothetical protein
MGGERHVRGQGATESIENFFSVEFITYKAALTTKAVDLLKRFLS